jgi:multiple sugar transport system substrate-binding protein
MNRSHESGIKRLGLLLLSVLVVAGVLTSCGAPATEQPSQAATTAPGGAPAGEPVTVYMNYWPGPESEALQKVIDYYNENVSKDTGVRVELALFTRDSHYTQIQTLFAAGNATPDTVMLDTASYGNYTKFLEPLEEHFADPSWNVTGGSLDTFIPSVVAALTKDDHVWCIPVDFSIHFLFYRTDLIDKLLSDPAWQAKYTALAEEHLGKSLSPKPPDQWDWDDFLVAAYFFTQKYNPDSPTQYGTSFQAKQGILADSMLFSTWSYSMGGTFWDDKGAPNIDNPGMLEAMTFVDKLRTEELIPPGFVNYEFPEANEAFGSGNVAFMVHWNAAFNIVNDPAQYPITAGKVGITHAPAGSAGAKTYLNSMSNCINVNSKHKREAFVWLSWLSHVDSMTRYAQVGGIPAVTEALEAVSATRPDMPVMADVAAKYAFRLGGDMQPALDIVQRDLSAAWVGTVSSAEALKTCQADLETWYATR